MAEFERVNKRMYTLNRAAANSATPFEFEQHLDSLDLVFSDRSDLVA